MYKITLITECLRQYRRKFHELLHTELKSIGIEYQLIYGKASVVERKKRDEVDLSWAAKIDNKSWSIFGMEICWQPCLNMLRDSDLIIVEQASKYVINYLLMLKRYFGGPKLAFWGHGRDFQASANTLKEKFKHAFINQVDWWFAYNIATVNIVKKAGFPIDHITDVQNAIDTKTLISIKSRTSQEELALLKKELNLKNDPIGIFCGGMYRKKRLPFLIDSCKMVKKRIPAFQMIFLGDGPGSNVVKSASEKYNWIHFVGPKFDKEKVKYFCLANVLLMPGLVGLVVLDSFALEVPMVTTDYEFHSPEIAYMKHGVNGIITKNDLTSYSNTVVDILLDQNKHQVLVKGCRESAQEYSVEDMAQNFSEGIKKCLLK